MLDGLGRSARRCLPFGPILSLCIGIGACGPSEEGSVKVPNDAPIPTAAKGARPKGKVSKGAPTPAEAAERTEALSLLGAVLDRLSDDKRAALILAEIEGMSAPEIAEVTRTPLNTVYTRLRRARAGLNDALASLRKDGR